jgi:hypothetical protein
LLAGYEFGQITIPETDKSYKTHITDLLTHVTKGSKTAIDIDESKKKLNIVNVYVDARNPQMIVLRWNGKLV